MHWHFEKVVNADQFKAQDIISSQIFQDFCYDLTLSLPQPCKIILLPLFLSLFSIYVFRADVALSFYNTLISAYSIK